MNRAALLALLILAVALLGAGCATTGSSGRPSVDVGGSYQLRYTTFHGGTR